MDASAVFPTVPPKAGMYESFYLRAVAPEEPVGAWLRYTVHKRPGEAPKGSLWCTVFDAKRGRPFMHKLTSAALSAPAGGWIAIEQARLGPGHAEGGCGGASWSLKFESDERELRHLGSAWMYRARLPRTKLTSPAPDARFRGTIELPDRGPLALEGWRGMVGHNWGSEHAERWIWLHGIGFAEDESAWLDLALGRIRIAGRRTPWVANGALSLDGRRVRLGGLGRRGLSVSESAEGCELRVPGEGGAVIEARVEVPADSAAGWRYADPDGSGHEVVNCSVAKLELDVTGTGAGAGAGRSLTSAHGGAYELGMRAGERHGVQIAPFADG
ncbi:MAG TPA: hypothetical protein VES65_02505 [Solirubrobacteraceae bacterium]|nr:hypothetical protein [Solirubrobacteraceae bacterium]